MEPIHAVSIFQTLEATERDQLAQIALKRQFPADKVIFSQGDRADALYVILSGSVRVYQTSEAGTETTTNILGQGSLFGEMSMIDGRPRAASVATVEPTQMLAIGHRAFRDFCNANPAVLWKLLEILCDRLSKGSEDLQAMSCRDVPYRLLRTLRDLCVRHGQQRLDGTRINLRLTAQLLAGMVGASPERVSGLLVKYQQEKMLLREGEYFLVPDLRTLERSIEFEKDWS